MFLISVLENATHKFVNSLQSQKTSVLRSDRAPKMCVAMHVLRSVLEHPVPQRKVLSSVDRDSLEPTPPKRDDQRVAGLENLLVPAMLLDAHADVASVLLARDQAADDYRVARVEVLDELAGHALDFHAEVEARAEALELES